MKDLTNYEFLQESDHFGIRIGNYLSFRKEILRDFTIQLRDTYLAQIDKFQWKISRVDLLFSHNRGFVWNQEQSARNPKDTNNWKERV